MYILNFIRGFCMALADSVPASWVKNALQTFTPTAVFLNLESENTFLNLWFGTNFKILFRNSVVTFDMIYSFYK